MNDFQLAPWFDSLPMPLRSLAAIGSVGKLHLLDLAGHTLAHVPARPDLAPHCASMVLAAFGETPLSGELAAQIVNTPALAPLMGEQANNLLRTLVRHWQQPENLSYFKRIIGQRDTAKIKHFLESRIQQEPENLFWREQAASVGMYEADYNWLATVLGDTFMKDLGPLHHALTAQIEQAKGNHTGAEKCLAAIGDTFGRAWTAMSKAQCRILAGDHEDGLGQLFRSLYLAPWQTQAALAIHDMLSGAAEAKAPLPGSTAILLYSWNKERDVADALAAIHASDLGDAKVFALDNGSTDGTGDVMRGWQQKFGNERMEVISLPVNVGAAAARNWLMHLPEVRASEFCVYLDDDTVVPTDWLDRFGAAVQAYPEAGVWGCKVVDASQPSLMQSVDYHLMPLAEPQSIDLTNTTPHQVKLSNLHIQVLDAGQFDYLRPCASVTGCCHLFRTERLHETGDFSLFLSPSQYDDMERDLRMLAGGRTGAYQGHLTVHHRKRSGKAALVETTQEANAIGNRYKMSVMHEPEEISESTTLEQRAIIEDLSAKLRMLDNRQP